MDMFFILVKKYKKLSTPPLRITAHICFAPVGRFGLRHIFYFACFASLAFRQNKKRHISLDVIRNCPEMGKNNMKDITFIFADAKDEEVIKNLLLEAALPHKDISNHLHHFLLAKSEESNGKRPPRLA
jgi:hypothetical protein